MSLAYADWIVIAVYFGLVLAIGVVLSRRAGKSTQNFFLGGRNLPWWVAGTSMVATTFAADTPLLITEIVAKDGISGNWIWWNMLIGGMLTTFFFARLWRRAHILTDLEFIELRYSGQKASFLRGFKSLYLGLFLNVIIISWVNLALKQILQGFFDIPDSTVIWYIAGAMLIVALYSTLSGFMGVAITDLLQFVVAMTGCTILAVIVINSDEVGGISGLQQQLADKPGAFRFLPVISWESSKDALKNIWGLGLGSFIAYAFMQWWASWYPGAEPGGGGYVAQRMMSTKNEKHAIGATLFFQIAHYCLRPWPWILVALAALVVYPDLPADEKSQGYVLAMRDFLPAGLRGMLLAAFLAAYMSTISTQLNWGASYSVNDFYQRFIAPGASEKHLVLISRISTVVLMILGLLVTQLINTFEEAWRFLLDCGAGLGMVLILRWYWWRINAWSEITATIAPFVAYIFISSLNWEFPSSFFFVVGFTTVSWITVTLLTPPTDANTLDRFYRKIRPGGFWKPVQQQTDLDPVPSKRMWGLAGCWVLAVVFAYSVLFWIGKVIFMEWTAVAWLSAVIVASGLSLFYLSGKVKIFDEEF